MNAEAQKALDSLKSQADAEKAAERQANYSAFVSILNKAYDVRTDEEHKRAIHLISEVCPFFPPVPIHLQNARQEALEHSYPHFSYNLFSRGTKLCTAGAPCRNVIFLLKGSVSSVLAEIDGKTSYGGTLIASGNILGEREAVRNDGRWESTVIGTENGEYLSINKSAFARLFDLGTYVSLSEAQILMRIKGFHRLGPIETVMSLCTGFQRKIYGAGSIYLRENEPMLNTVIVKDGAIRVYKNMPDEVSHTHNSGEPFNFHEYRSQFFKPPSEKEHLVELSTVGRDEMLCYPFKKGSVIPTSDFSYIAHTGSILLLLNLDQFRGKLNISLQGRHEIRKYMAKINGQRSGRCSDLSKASEVVGTMMQDRSESIPWQEAFAAREQTIISPVILPELVGSPSKSKVGQKTALDSKIRRDQFAALSAKLIRIRQNAPLSLDPEVVADTYSAAAALKARNYQKNQFDKRYLERVRKFREEKLQSVDHSFSNLPQNIGFSALLRRSMELIGSFQQGSLAHNALIQEPAPFLQTKSVSPPPKFDASNKSHSSFAEEKVSTSFEKEKPQLQIFDERELRILRHARNTLSIRHQQPIYLSSQTLEFSAENSSFSRLLPAPPSTRAAKQPSQRSKSHLGFIAPDDPTDSWTGPEVPKDTIPRENRAYSVRPCSHNTPRPSTSNSTSSSHAKGT